MRKFLKITFIIFVLILVGLWSPWLGWDIDVAGFFGVETPDPVSALRVNSLRGDLRVFIDDEEVGTASEEENFPLIVDALSPGEKAVRIERIANETAEYWEYNKLINFVDGIDTVISYLVGPEEEFSEGHVITVREKTNENYNLRINLNVDDASVELDSVLEEVSGSTYTKEISLEKQYDIRIEKPGFESIEFTILPEDQIERDKFSRYIINVDVQLMYQPVVVE